MEAATQYDRSILILEDLGSVVSNDDVSVFTDETSNLLNITEGLMSILGNVIIVLTFNHDIGKINPAILRPGRCIGRIEIDNLSYDQAQKLVDFQIPNSSYSLAEVYEMNKIRKPLEIKDKKIGFIR